VTILLGISISRKMTGPEFVNPTTILIVGMGLLAFVFDTAGGVISAKILNLFLPKDSKVNPMVGAAGISAFPMSSRVIQRLGQEADKGNFLLMHAVGANVAGQIGSVIAGGILLAWLGG
jgi:oxaloacetate decarboxylase beta subunit